MPSPQNPASGPGTVPRPSGSPVQPEIPPIGEPGILPRQTLDDNGNSDAPPLADDLGTRGLADPRDLVGAEPYEEIDPTAPAPELPVDE